MGDLPLQIDWSLNGRIVQTNASINGITTMMVGQRSSVLTIDPVEHDHVGNFTCHAKNQAGIQSFNTQLNIYG